MCRLCHYRMVAALPSGLSRVARGTLFLWERVVAPMLLDYDHARSRGNKKMREVRRSVEVVVVLDRGHFCSGINGMMVEVIRDYNRRPNRP